MKVRQHRGGLIESMATVVNLPEPTLVALEVHVQAILGLSERPVLRLSSLGYDGRTQWGTYEIFVEGHGVFGYCNQIPSS